MGPTARHDGAGGRRSIFLGRECPGAAAASRIAFDACRGAAGRVDVAESTRFLTITLMLAFHFGPRDRRTFGIYHEPAPGAALRGGVLLCNPLGQEAVRVHRLYRVLADRLSRSGMHVLRFDYFGTGDSPGDDVDGDLDGWVQDVKSASQELARRSGQAPQIWEGARLGATLALMAAASAAQPPSNLVLWEPVIDGADYLRSLAEATVASLEVSFTIPDPAWRARLKSQPEALEREGIGFELGALLHGQLRGLSAAMLPTPAARHTTIVKPDASTRYDSLTARWRQAQLGVEEIVHLHDFDWVAEEALNTSLVPAEIVQRMAGLAIPYP